MAAKGDWVKVAGEGDEAFMVIGVEGKSVHLCSGVTEPAHKVEKIDLDKYEIVSYIVNKWHKKWVEKEE